MTCLVLVLLCLDFAYQSQTTSTSSPRSLISPWQLLIAQQLIAIFSQHISHFLRNSSWTRIDRLNVIFESVLDVCVEFKDNSACATKKLMRTVTEDCPNGSEGSNFAESLINALPLDKLTVLQVYVHPSPGFTFYPQFWASMAALPAIQEVDLEGNYYASFSAVLLALVPNLATCDFDDGIDRMAEPFPALSRLMVRRSWLSGMMHGKSAVRHLVDYLHSREKPLEIVLEQCDAQPLDLVLLSRTTGICIVGE